MGSTSIKPDRILFPTAASDPTGAVAGEVYYNTTDKSLKIFDGTAWEAIYEPPIGSADNPVTSSNIAQFAGSAGSSYYIKPPDTVNAFQAEYSGGNYKGTGRGYFLWWRAAVSSAPTVNFIGNSYKWNQLMIEQQGSGYHTIGFSTYQTFNTRSDTSTGNSGTRSGYRVYFGSAGGHGIYNTSQSPCNWGDSNGAYGAGWNGSTCGSWPNGLLMGTGQGGTPVYTGISGTWDFWFSF